MSNMYEARLEWNGRTYRNSEAAYQSAKSFDPTVRDVFCTMTGKQAKIAGNTLQLRADWELIKVSIMEDNVRAKFSQNPVLLNALIDTGDK